jgi:hypothetical protein
LPAQKSITQQKTQGLKATQVLDGQWAVVSNDSRKPLTESDANRIIAAYLAINDLVTGVHLQLKRALRTLTIRKADLAKFNSENPPPSQSACQSASQAS